MFKYSSFAIKHFVMQRNFIKFFIFKCEIIYTVSQGTTNVVALYFKWV